MQLKKNYWLTDEVLPVQSINVPSCMISAIHARSVRLECGEKMLIAMKNDLYQVLFRWPKILRKPWSLTFPTVSKNAPNPKRSKSSINTVNRANSTAHPINGARNADVSSQRKPPGNRRIARLGNGKTINKNKLCQTNSALVHSSIIKTV